MLSQMGPDTHQKSRASLASETAVWIRSPEVARRSAAGQQAKKLPEAFARHRLEPGARPCLKAWPQGGARNTRAYVASRAGTDLKTGSTRTHARMAHPPSLLLLEARETIP